MTTYSVNTLSQLPPPEFVEAFSVEDIFQQRLAELRQLDPELADNLRVGDPTYNNLLQGAIREAKLRQRINEAGKAILPAYAKNSDLDQLGALYYVFRQVVDPGDPGATPPVDPIMEEDERFLERIMLSMEGQTNAGTAGFYRFHALSSDAEVLNSAEKSPTPGQVLISILSRLGDGTASTALLDRVRTYMLNPEVRQMTDELIIQSVTVSTYRIEAVLTLEPGPTAGLALEEARAKAQEYVSLMHRKMAVVSVSGIYAALQQPGVVSVNLTSPLANINPGDTGTAYCSAIELSSVVANG
ncbi:baseplate assembly protein [Endozoicomonas sp. ALD040]|uniref:baseplate assembly protein n=1 Tax=Endozoicomonas sp. ALD040 TaxID=3403079 RepID=UPI003BAE29FC